MQKLIYWLFAYQEVCNCWLTTWPYQGHLTFLPPVYDHLLPIQLRSLTSKAGSSEFEKTVSNSVQCLFHSARQFLGVK